MSLKNSLIVLWVYIMYVLGLWIFLSGYLLKRIVVHQNSRSSASISGDINCGNITSLNDISEKFEQNLSLLEPEISHKNHFRRFDKAVFVIIDALRYDFVESYEASTAAEMYINKMPILKETVQKFPEHAILLHVSADPPTTTLQRLKGLTTGSFPTFIDVSLNFASVEITEDNWVRQMNSLNRNVIFLGDDTWEGLFPNQFHRSFPYPSFNVKDLDTVDSGIISHIFTELEKNDSDIIIAHFLGVDHCGHRYGPNHPEMSRKLQQMNSVIQKLIESLKADTLLIVLGDHGMTKSGDHGGDSFSETSTALFAYSPSKLLFDIVPCDKLSAAQIDIVPTLSLLLGSPIPYSNLGSIIPRFFSLNTNGVCFHEKLDPLVGSALAAAENCVQVQRYLRAYSLISTEISSSFIMTSDEMLKNTSQLWRSVSHDISKSSHILKEIQQGYMDYMHFIRSSCAKKWANFNIELIAIGLLILCFSVACNFWIAEQLNFGCFLTIAGCLTLIFTLLALYFYQNIILCLPILIVIIGILIKFQRKFIELISNLKPAIRFPTVVITFLFLSSFSNSFVVYEDHVALFLLQSMILYRFCPSVINTTKAFFASTNIKPKSTKRIQKWNWKLISQPLLLMCLMISIRMGQNFYRCREEQIACVNSDFITPLEKIHGLQTYKEFRLIVSLISLIIPVTIFLTVINYGTTLKSPTVTAICVKYGIFFGCVCICLRWWLNIVSPGVVDKILRGNEVILTRFVTVTSLTMCIAVFIFPILSEKPWESLSKEIYNGSLGYFLFILLQLIYLIAGDAMAPAVMFMSLSVILYILLSESSSELMETHVWIDAIVWSLSSRYWFYGTAHQPTFASIQWDAAFLLNYKEIYSYTLSGILVVLNTFCSNVLHGLSLPLILTWPQPYMCSSKSLLKLHMKYLFCFGFKLLGTVCASIILRQHLMVWKIFSPKLLFEVVGIIISMACVSVSHCFMSIVISKYHTFIRSHYGNPFVNKE
ncbi:GPI ethanolamine phosphate transferase 3-like [Uloborus diversus]|uniref:GPI ethanolamine phosphate transferase 3-like n=1 Tax=Uloborus diversus TaxID=327109 RepID=UPI00240A1A8D|nr:GPI ethanolamine phosphate transferase 3-like [Uloborus diversus]